jgi:hypothetical protein
MRLIAAAVSSGNGLAFLGMLGVLVVKGQLGIIHFGGVRGAGLE